MPIGGNAQVTINVGAKLQVLQSSINDIQKILDKLEPKSTAFQRLNSIISNIRTDMEKLQAQSARGFISQAQFNQTEKTIDKIETSLNRTKIIVDNLKFKDIKLTKEQEDTFKGFEDELEKIEERYNATKENIKANLFSDTNLNQTLFQIDKNAVNKDLEDVEKIVQRRANTIKTELAVMGENIKNLEGEVSKGTRAKNLIGDTGFTKDTLGEDIFNKYLYTKGGETLLKPGVLKSQFLAELEKEFDFHEGELSSLGSLTFKQIQQAFKDMGTGARINPFAGLTDNLEDKASQLSELTANQVMTQNFANAIGILQQKFAELNGDQGEVTIATEEYNQAIAVVAAAITEYQSDILGATRAMGENAAANDKNKQTVNQLRDALSQANAEFLKQQRQIQTFNSIKSAVVNFMGFNQVLNITRNAVRAAINHIKELDTTMNGIAIVTDMTTADLWKQVDAYSSMAQNFGVTIQGAYEVSKIYYQAGYETNEVLTLTNETLKLAKISGLDYATTTDYMMTAMRGFKLEMEDASRVVDVYSNLAANTAVSQQELAEAMTRTASSMESVGATFEETSAMIATMVAVTRESANNIGSAMKSIASRYGELTKDPGKLLDAEGEAMSFNKVDTALKSVGITLQTTDHQFRDFTDVIIELAEKWDTLDSAQQRYIATQFAGNRQQSRFLALVSNIDLLRENMSNAENSEDIGTLQSLKALDSLESKINQVQVAYQQFYTTIGIEDVWKGFLDGAKNVIDTLNSLPKIFGKIPAAAVILIMNAINLIKAGLLQGISAIAKVIKTSLDETKTEITQTTQEAENQGKNWAENLAIGFENGAKKLKSTVTSVIDGLKPIQKAPERKYTTEQGAFFNNWDSSVAALNVKSEGGKFSSANSPEWKQAFNELLEQLNAVGLGFDTSKMNAEKLCEKLQELSPAVHKLAEEYNNTENKIKEYDAYQRQHQQNVLKAASTFSELGMGLSSLSLLFNDGSAKGKAFSGVMMILGGTLTAVAAGMKAVHGASGWIGLAVTAVTTIVSGFATAIESSAEKLERLNKEAEELNNKAKEAKANYNTLQRSADKYEELKAKRYESAEAAKEYQSAVEELADSFPQLISTISDTGEITLNANNIEMELAKAREKTATATYEALQAEQKAKLKELQSKQEKLAPTNTEYRGKIENAIQSLLQQISSLPDDFRAEQGQEYIKELEKYQQTLQGSPDISTEELNDIFIKIQKIADNSYNDLLKYDSSYEETAPFSNAKYFTQTTDAYGEYQKATQEYQEALESFTSITRQEAAAWIRTQTYSNDARFKAFKDNSVLSSLLSNQLYEAYTGREDQSQLWGDWIKEQEANTEIDLLYNWYQDLDSGRREILESMFSNPEKYSGTDIVKALELGPDDDEISKIITSYYEEGAKWYKEQIEKSLENSGLELEINEKDQLSNQDWQFVSEASKQYSVLKRISQTQAAGYEQYIQNLYAATNGEQEIQQLLIDNGLSTRSGIEATIKELKARKEKENTNKYDGIIESLDQLSQYVQDNIYLTATSMTDSILSDWKDNSSDIMNLRTGVSYDKAKEFIDKAKALGLETIKYETSGDKIIFSEQTYQEYLTKYYEDKKAQAKKLSEDALEAANWLKNNSKLTETTKGYLETILGVTGAADFIENETYINKKSKIITQTGLKYLSTQAQNAVDAAETNVEWVERVYEEIQRQSNYAIGNYQKDVDTLREIATNHQLSANDVVGQEIQKSLNDAYSSLISDVMTYGFKNINLNHYTGLIADDREHLNEMIESGIKSGDYTSFIRYYADFAGKTLEETNALIVQALEKQQQSTIGAAQEALRNVDFYNKDTAFASLDTIQNLADALGQPIEALLGEYNASIDKYKVKNISYWYNQITNSSDILFDSINSVINSIVKYINSGLEGKLSGADFVNFSAMIQQLIPNFREITMADFTQTKDGLKISQELATSIYLQLKQINSIQAQITFNDLNKSLQESNEHYKSISDILVRIKELQDAIANAEANGVSNARINQYREELALAQEIAATRSLSEDKSFDFMNQDLPSAFKNPVNYWNSTGQMLKSMNESAKTGYMEVDDFYNMVNEMSNLARLSGQEINFMGETLDGHAETAAALIEKGFGALSNVDGEGVKIDLGKIGLAFAEGAESLGEGFEAGIHQMAQSQIDMLDGMIAVLETIVQMEEAFKGLDVDDSGSLEIGEIFDGITDNITEPLENAKFAPKFEEARAKLLEAIEGNEQLKDLAEQLNISGVSLKQILQATPKELADLGFTMESYTRLMNEFYKLANSNDWDPNDLSSVLNMLEGTGLVIDYFNAETGKEFVVHPQLGAFTVDWNDEKFVESVRKNFGNAGIQGKSEEEMRKILEQGRAGKFNSVQERLAYELQYGFVIKTEAGYEIKGEKGKTYKDPKEAIQASIIKQEKDARKATYNEKDWTFTTEGGFTYKVTLDGEGQTTYTTEDGIKAYSYEDLEYQAVQKEIQRMKENEDTEGLDAGEIELQAKYNLGIEIEPNIRIDEKALSDAENTTVEAAKEAWSKYKNGELELNAIRGALGEVGIKISPKVEELSFGETQQINEALKVDGTDAAEKIETAKNNVVDGITNGFTEGATAAGTILQAALAAGASAIAEVLNLPLTKSDDVHAGESREETQARAEAELKRLSQGNGSQNRDNTSLSTKTDTEQEAQYLVDDTANSLSNLGKEAEAATTELARNAEITAENNKISQHYVDINTHGNTGSVQFQDDYSVATYGQAPPVSPDIYKETQQQIFETNKKIQETSEKAAADSKAAVETLSTHSEVIDAVIERANQLKEINSEIEKLSSLTDETSSAEELAAAGEKINELLEQKKQLEEPITVQVSDEGSAEEVKAALESISEADWQSIVNIEYDDPGFTPPSGLSIEVKVNYDDSGFTPTKGNVRTYGGGIGGNGNKGTKSSRNNYTSSKGNVALASGRGTLMGELGPELVVSKGRYFVVGQNGAEFVDLDPDAIVFNHLQTEHLLKNGTAGHGRPVTNERKATSLATGNISGPAMASASAVLAALKQLRAMWQSLLGASAKDLGSQAGRGGGGGGKDKENPFQRKSTTAEIQRWYNLLRQIDKLERDISYQETLRAKIETDRVANGKAYYKSQRESLKAIDEELIRQKQLVYLQKSWYDNKREELANSQYGHIFTYDENGLQQYVGSGAPGSGLGLDILEHLTRRTVEGELAETSASAMAQLDYLRSVGFDTDILKINEDGTRVDFNIESAEDQDNMYVQMMENFWSAVDGWRDELDSLYDSYEEQQNKILENEQKRNEILQQIVDNQLALENKVLDAIVDAREREIEELKKQRDALNDAADRYIDGLNDQLAKERQMYENQEDETELNRLRRQLAILQRSGGSASQISSLQKQIESMEKDRYFDSQQQQIDAIKEASDLEIERLDAQIDLMTETLEYQKENGLLWGDVQDIMSRSEADIVAFIEGNKTEWANKSTLAKTDDTREIQNMVGQWIGYRDDEGNYIEGQTFAATVADAIAGTDDHNWATFNEAMKNLFGDSWNANDENMKNIFDNEYKVTADPNIAALKTINSKGFQDIVDAVKGQQTVVEAVTAVAATPTTTTPTSSGGGGGGGGSGGSSKKSGGSSSTSKTSHTLLYTTYSDKDNVYHIKTEHYSDGNVDTEEKHDNDKKVSTGGTDTCYCSKCGHYMGINSKSSSIKTLSNASKETKQIKAATSIQDLKEKMKNSVMKVLAFKKGGEIDFTGPAWVDGTKQKPEGILNAEQLKLLRRSVLTTKNPIMDLINNHVSNIGKLANADTYNSINHGSITIEKAEVNMNVAKLANDYDAKRAGESALEEMVRIARKSGVNNLGRR